MPKISIKEAKKQASGSVRVAGWVRNKRELKGLIFIDLVDISSAIQLVFLAGTPVYDQVKDLPLESVIAATGELKEKPAKKGAENQEKDFELAVSEVEVISVASANLPIPVLNKIDNEANLENRLDWRWLDLRQADKQLIFKVWTKLEEGFRDYFRAAGFIQVNTPCLMSTASETGSEVFEVKYFDRKAYLSQSPQFYKQMAMAAGLEKVFVYGPVFRAEPSYTTRHVTEFTGWDFEMSFIDSHYDIMDAEEDMLIAGFKRLKEDLGLEVDIPSKPFPRISLKDAKTKLKEAGVKSEKENDFSPEEERELCALIKKELGHDFIFVVDYPISTRPFYHMRHADDNSLTKSFDLLYRGLEITTGAQREHRPEILEKQALEKGMNLEELKDYLNFFRYGCPNHGGAGIGPARIVMKILDVPNVKEACFLPRDVRRLTP